MKDKSVDLIELAKHSYLSYAKEVITSRAFADARDGMKPVQRRVLYSMNEIGLSPDKPYKKCARVVGDVLGKYHPHGDSSVYGALVKMAQDFYKRYPLVDGHGNFGSPDDSEAAMRYTESRLTPYAMTMLEDLEKNTVNWIYNYDDSLMEPEVLPGKFPNLLANGSQGIAVGMASEIPSHNLGEVCDGIIAVIDNKKIKESDILEYIKGPDFPTGGIVDPDGLEQCMTTGKGTIKIRAKVSVEETEKRNLLVITELPHQISNSAIIEKAAKVVTEKAIKEVTAIRDESNKDGVRIVIEIIKSADYKAILELLYQKTDLQVNYNYDQRALVDGKAVMMSTKAMIMEYIKFRTEIIRKRTEHLLAKAERRAHILEGLLRALDIIDEIYFLIRKSNAPKEDLIKKFGFTPEQSQAILDIRLVQLTKMEAAKLQKEQADLIKQIAAYKKILSSEKNLVKEVRGEVTELRALTDERRTVIMPFDKIKLSKSRKGKNESDKKRRVSKTE